MADPAHCGAGGPAADNVDADPAADGDAASDNAHIDLHSHSFHLQI